MWVPVPDPDEVAAKDKKWKIALVILILILIGELTYFFYIVPNKKITTTIAPTIVLFLV
ncbi:hypothetical protein CANDROIZ_660009 [Candidatus Roizmanbacteria bacterium]|nr:hypothetical protein CANDROIZ_660009 [Candidatus Roizmanbacteria bacterium]